MKCYTIALKLTNACNLNCLHCYDIISNHYPTYMSEDVFKQTLIFIESFIQMHSDDDITIMFVGGEIALADFKKIAMTIQMLNKYKNTNYIFYTNLAYNISDSMLQFLKNSGQKDNIFVKTSWDYKIRFFGCQDLEQQFFRNLQLLSYNGIKTVTTIVLTTLLVNELTPVDIFEKFLKNRCYNIYFETLLLNKNNQWLYPKNRNADNWLVNAYQLAYKQYRDVITVEDFAELLVTIKNKQKIISCHNDSDSYITINTDGSIAFRKIAADLTYGTVFDGIDVAMYQKCESCKCTITNACMICKYYNVLCTGACKYAKFDDSGCPGKINLISEILRHA